MSGHLFSDLSIWFLLLHFSLYWTGWRKYWDKVAKERVSDGLSSSLTKQREKIQQAHSSALNGARFDASGGEHAPPKNWNWNK